MFRFFGMKVYCPRVMGAALVFFLTACKPVSLDPEALGGHLEQRDGQPVIVLDRGDVFPIEDEGFSGYVGHAGFRGDDLVLPGWAVDTQRRSSVAALVVILDDEIVASVAPDRDRDHVLERWGESANPAGFSVSIPRALVKETGAVPRLYALRMEDSKAAGQLRLTGRARCILEEHFDDPARCD